MKLTKVALAFLLLMPLLSPSNLHAQGFGTIVGTVTDSSGAALLKATVTVTEIKTGAKREAHPDEKGYYIITNLAPSSYTITATAENFAPAELQDYMLSAGQERTLNLSLHPGTVATEINVVSGELTEVETSSAAIGANVNAREVGQLPLNGRQLSQLYLLRRVRRPREADRSTTSASAGARIRKTKSDLTALRPVLSSMRRRATLAVSPRPASGCNPAWRQWPSSGSNPVTTQPNLERGAPGRSA